MIRFNKQRLLADVVNSDLEREIWNIRDSLNKMEAAAKFTGIVSVVLTVLLSYSGTGEWKFSLNILTSSSCRNKCHVSLHKKYLQKERFISVRKVSELAWNIWLHWRSQKHWLKRKKYIDSVRTYAIKTIQNMQRSFEFTGCSDTRQSFLICCFIWPSCVFLFLNVMEPVYFCSSFRVHWNNLNRYQDRHYQENKLPASLKTHLNGHCRNAQICWWNTVCMICIWKWWTLFPWVIAAAEEDLFPNRFYI